MATRRMFSREVIMTDDFLELPPTSKVLYFFLNLEADDDGFVGNPKTIMRLTGTTKEDMKLLIDNDYIILFETGVIVITDWTEHNSIRKDRKKDTRFIKEKQQLTLDNAGKYQWLSVVQPNDNQVTTEKPPNGCIGKDRLGEDRLGEVRGVEDEAPAQNPIFEKLKEAFGEMSVGSRVVEETKDLLETHGQALVLLALDETILNAGKSIRYTRAILENWQGRGLKTVEQVKQNKADYQQQKQPPQKAKPQTREEWEKNWSEEHPF